MSAPKLTSNVPFRLSASLTSLNRFVQLTPPGSACSIALGKGLSDMEPGTMRGLQVVVDDADAARAHLVAQGIEATDVQDFPGGRFVFFSDPDGNGWAIQQIVRPPAA